MDLNELPNRAQNAARSWIAFADQVGMPLDRAAQIVAGRISQNEPIGRVIFLTIEIENLSRKRKARQ